MEKGQALQTPGLSIALETPSVGGTETHCMQQVGGTGGRCALH